MTRDTINMIIGILGSNTEIVGNYIVYKTYDDSSVGGVWVNNNVEQQIYNSNKRCWYMILMDGVTTIGGGQSTDYSPFYSNNNVAEIDLSSSGLTSIDKYAFLDCSGLTSIKIPDSVTFIGGGAFYVCSGLTSIVIPNSVTFIGDSAFSYCYSLTSITIPNGVTSISDSTFSYCYSLESIKVDSNNTTYDSRNNCNAIIETSSNTLIVGCKNTIIPDSVTSIDGGAFSYCYSLTSIVIPNSVTFIGSYTFYDCTGLTSIVIPNSVTFIGGYAFYGCSRLTSVTCLATNPPTLGSNNFTASNDTLYVTEESVASYQSVSSWNTAFTNIEAIPPMILYKSSQAVSGNWVTNNTDTNRNTYDSITHEGVLYLNPVVTIGGGQSTDYSPFYNNNNVAEIDLSSSGLTSIDMYAFNGCSELTSITIPDSVTSIGGSAFRRCSRLTSITIPNGVTSISGNVFNGCSKLTSITIPDSVTSIGDGAFAGCSKLTSIIIPDSVTSIGNSVFAGCSKLTSIKIPNSVTSIGFTIFNNCSSLTSIEVDSNNTSYDSRNNCNAIIETSTNTLIAGCQNTVIPDDVTSIGHGAFFYCYNLTSITIPDSVTFIGDSAFNGCSRLTSVTCLATNPPTLGFNNFAVSNDDTLYVPSESVDLYKANANWSSVFGVDNILPIV